MIFVDRRRWIRAKCRGRHRPIGYRLVRGTVVLPCDLFARFYSSVRGVDVNGSLVAPNDNHLVRRRNGRRRGVLRANRAYLDFGVDAARIAIEPIMTGWYVDLALGNSVALLLTRIGPLEGSLKIQELDRVPIAGIQDYFVVGSNGDRNVIPASQ